MSTSFIPTPVSFQEKAGTNADAADAANVNVVRKMLCKPVSYDTVQNIIYNRHFLADQVIISMRLLCLSTDLPVIYNWLPWEYTRHLKKEAHVERLTDGAELTEKCVIEAREVTVLEGSENGFSQYDRAFFNCAAFGTPADGDLRKDVERVLLPEFLLLVSK